MKTDWKESGKSGMADFGDSDDLISELKRKPHEKPLLPARPIQKVEYLQFKEQASMIMSEIQESLRSLKIIDPENNALLKKGETAAKYFEKEEREILAPMLSIINRVRKFLALLERTARNQASFHDREMLLDEIGSIEETIGATSGNYETANVAALQHSDFELIPGSSDSTGEISSIDPLVQEIFEKINSILKQAKIFIRDHISPNIFRRSAG